MSLEVRNELITLCDIMIGIMTGAHPTNVEQIWSTFVGIIYTQDSSTLLDAVHNYTEGLIL